jgi:hypothetical protein
VTSDIIGQKHTTGRRQRGMSQRKERPVRRACSCRRLRRRHKHHEATSQHFSNAATTLDLTSACAALLAAKSLVVMTCPRRARYGCASVTAASGALHPQLSCVHRSHAGSCHARCVSIERLAFSMTLKPPSLLPRFLSAYATSTGYLLLLPLQ